MLIGQQNHLIRAQDGGRLGHKMDAAEDDDIGLSAGSVLAQLQRIADKIGYILDLAQLVVMGQDNSILLPLQAGDTVYQP